MKSQFTLKFLITLFAVFPVSAIANFEFDGMPINISEVEFTAKRPTAIKISEHYDPNKSTTYMYRIANPLMFEGAKVFTSIRSFESGKGCGISMGFQVNEKDKTQLIRRITGLYNQTHTLKPLGNTDQIVYLENEELFASIVFSKERGSKSLVHYITSKSCSVALARRRLTLPPQ